MVNEIIKKRIYRYYFTAGLPKSEISRRTGISYKTVLKIIDEFEMGVTVKEIRKPRPRVSDVYEKEVTEILEMDKLLKRKQRHTAVQVWYELLKIHPDFSLSYASVLRLYNRVWPKIFSATNLTDHDNVEPGTMYVATYTIDIKVNGEMESGCLLTVTFPYSNCTFYQVFRSDSLENVLYGLFSIYKHLGGIPPYQYFPDNQIFFERPNSSNGLCRPKDLFANFCLQNYFTRYYATDDAQRYRYHMERKKGRFIKQVLFGNLAVDSNISLFNEKLLITCEQLNDVVHHRRKIFKHELLIEEKSKFFKIPDPEYEIYIYGKKKAGHRAEVLIDKNIYVLPPSYQDVYVIYKVYYDHIVFENVLREFIMEYPRLYGKPGQISIDWSKYLMVLADKPGAYQNIDINKHFSKKLDLFLQNSNIDVRRRYFAVLRDVTDQKSLKEGVKVLETLCDFGCVYVSQIKKICKELGYETTINT